MQTSQIAAPHQPLRQPCRREPTSGGPAGLFGGGGGVGHKATVRPPPSPSPAPASLRLAWSRPRGPQDAPSLVPGVFWGAGHPSGAAAPAQPEEAKGKRREQGLGSAVAPVRATAQHGGTLPSSHPPLRTPGAARGSPRAARGRRRGAGGRSPPGTAAGLVACSQHGRPPTRRQARSPRQLRGFPEAAAGRGTPSRCGQARSSSAGAPTASPHPSPAAFPLGMASPVC